MSDLARKYDIHNPRSSDPPPCHAELALSLEGRSEASMRETGPQNHQTGRRNAKKHAKRRSHRVKIDVGKIEMGTWSEWARAQNPNLSE